MTTAWTIGLFIPAMELESRILQGLAFIIRLTRKYNKYECTID